MKQSWILLLALLLSACGSKKQIELLTNQNKALSAQVEELRAENGSLQSDMEKVRKYYDQITFLGKQLSGVHARMVTNYGDIELEFFPEKAPIHVFNFISRAESGFYNNTRFHRIIPGFMIQGGDPNSRDDNLADDGAGGPINNIPHEFNDVSHVPGILSMARQGNAALGAGCQFFIMHGSATHLNGQYTAFGKVSKGMDVVNTIATLQTYGNANPQLATQPLKPVIIRRVEVYRN